MDDQLLTTTQAGKILGLSSWTVASHADKGRIPSVTDGRGWRRFRAVDVHRYDALRRGEVVTQANEPDLEPLPPPRRPLSPLPARLTVRLDCPPHADPDAWLAAHQEVLAHA